jgi:hypothetical protein
VGIGVANRWIMTAGRYTSDFVAARLLRKRSCAPSRRPVARPRTRERRTARPFDVASSGQITLSELAWAPHAWWSIASLLSVLIFKSIAYALCLVSLRGGLVFPAVFLGGALGALIAPLPGYGVVSAMAAGMAASTAVGLVLALSSVVLVVLMLGNSGWSLWSYSLASRLLLPPSPYPKGHTGPELGAGQDRTPRSAAT